MSSLSYIITILLFRPKALNKNTNKNTYNADKRVCERFQWQWLGVKVWPWSCTSIKTYLYLYEMIIKKHIYFF